MYDTCSVQDFVHVAETCCRGADCCGAPPTTLVLGKQQAGLVADQRGLVAVWGPWELSVCQPIHGPWPIWPIRHAGVRLQRLAAKAALQMSTIHLFLHFAIRDRYRMGLTARFSLASLSPAAPTTLAPHQCVSLCSLGAADDASPRMACCGSIQVVECALKVRT
jgi:hypothetical protein